MKIVVIGTGASGYGAYIALKKNNMMGKAVFYSYGDKIKTTKTAYNNLPQIKIPEKKEFNFQYQSIEIKNSNLKIKYADTRGGLSDFWSGSVFPFSKRELKARKLDVLKKYYKSISEIIPIIGNNTYKDNIYPEYQLKEDLKQISSFDCFDKIKYDSENFDIFVSSNRVLSSSNCIYCGNCFKGCESNVIFRPSKNFFGAEIINAKIDSIKKIDGKWVLFDSNKQIIDSCDKLFLGLGVYQTIKLLIKSKLLDYKKVEIYDSNTITFPIKINSAAKAYDDNYGYANKIMTIQGKHNYRFDTQISLVPFNHFFTYSFFGRWIGGYFKTYLINKYALGMFFSSKYECNTFKINEKNQLYIKKDRRKEAFNTLNNITKIINSSFNDFKIIKLFKRSDSSIHYASNLLDINKNIFKRSELYKNLFVIDGNIFPNEPSANGNTFSIIAAAYAIVENKLSRKIRASTKKNENN